MTVAGSLHRLIQYPKILELVKQLATNYDIFFIQELQATSKNVPTVRDYTKRAGLQFFPGMGSDKTPNQTGSKPDKHIFTKLVNGATGTMANTTATMLTLAMNFFEDIYKQANYIEKTDLEAFIGPLNKSITPPESAELHRPFTVNELFIALKSSHRATSTGPDGIQYQILSHSWNEIGPISTTLGRQGCAYPVDPWI
ncbi:hypothetical protein JCM33374_g3765 [Metschnikowia sp. JCM 33374]|nr:hypothetical protein JCM33374_g3765 [Metschnikowia sp. JCM 33374]